MKGRQKQIITMLSLCAMAAILFSCINESDRDCVQYALKARVVNTRGEFVPDSVVTALKAFMFINGRYDHEVTAEPDGRYLLSFYGGTKVSLALLGGASSDSVGISIPQYGDSLSRLSVRTDAPLPYYLYYGRFDYTPVSATASGTVLLPLYNKRARLYVKVKNLRARFGEGNYRVMMEGFRNGIAFSGEVCGDSVSYMPDGRFNGEGDYVSDAVNVLPNKKGEYVTLQIYKDGKPLISVSTDAGGNPVTLSAGDEECMVVDVSAFKLFIEVMDWMNINQGNVID